MACRARLVVQYLWASQQAIEKYLKCILLLHRIPATNVRHDLEAALACIAHSEKLRLDLTENSLQFIRYLDQYGRFRYLEISNVAFGHDIINLDRAVWGMNS